MYDAADYLAGVQIGTISQVFYNEPSCVTAKFNLSSSGCSLASPGVLDSCGPLPDGPPPLYGVLGPDVWMHGVVKNCTDVIDRIVSYMPGTS